MRIYTDASTDGIHVGLGWVCRPTVEDVPDHEGNLPITGEYTSMSAEWYALCRGAICADELGADTAYIHTDCTPLVEKMKWPDVDGLWAKRFEWFNDMLVDRFETWKFVDISRAGNTEADRLAKEALYRARQR